MVRASDCHHSQLPGSKVSQNLQGADSYTAHPKDCEGAAPPPLVLHLAQAAVSWPRPNRAVDTPFTLLHDLLDDKGRQTPHEDGGCPYTLLPQMPASSTNGDRPPLLHFLWESVGGKAFSHIFQGHHPRPGLRQQSSWLSPPSPHGPGHHVVTPTYSPRQNYRQGWRRPQQTALPTASSKAPIPVQVARLHLSWPGPWIRLLVFRTPGKGEGCHRWRHY